MRALPRNNCQGQAAGWRPDGAPDSLCEWNTFSSRAVGPTACLRPIRGQLAILACMTLAACESIQPTELVEQVDIEGAQPKPAVVEIDSVPRPVDDADRLIDRSCGRRADRLCVIEVLANLVADNAATETTETDHAVVARTAANLVAGNAATETSPTAGTKEQVGSNDNPRPRRLHDRLWRLTGTFSQAQVTTLAQSHHLAPLWRLRAALSASRSRQEQVARFRAWADRHPSHPFAVVAPTSLAEPPAPGAPLGRVGLFVPLSGALSAAGRAVRDGFIAAWLDDPGPHKSPLRIYDTAARPLAELYEQSLVDDIRLIVGPLSKQRLEALRRLNPTPAVLGLNYLDKAICGSGRATDLVANPNTTATEAPCKALDEAPAGIPVIGQRPGGAMPNDRQHRDSLAGHPGIGQRPGGAMPSGPRPPGQFLQLGLAIEDEAATIADRLLTDDFHRLLAVHSTEEWSVRGARALADAWPLEIETQSFADVKTLTESIGDAMRITASTERGAALEALLRTELEFLPRPRSDIDGVVAFVDHIEATALAPALKFHFAAHLPVYASSQSIRNAAALGELSGFRVTEMPFNLHAHPLWDRMRKGFDKGDGNIATLHALGMDAYRVVALWDWVADGEPLYGATGELRLAGDGRLRRRLAWASVSSNGIRPAPAGATR